MSCPSGALEHTLLQGCISLSVLLEQSDMRVFLFLNIECQVTFEPPCVVTVTYHFDFHILHLKVCNHLPTKLTYNNLSSCCRVTRNKLQNNHLPGLSVYLSFSFKLRNLHSIEWQHYYE